MQGWRALNAQDYDAAGKASSVLKAALTRNVIAEVAAVLGKEVGAVFNYFHKFFDTMDIPS